jgi:hypothetical protein
MQSVFGQKMDIFWDKTSAKTLVHGRGGGGEKYCVLCNNLMWMFHKNMEIQSFDVQN